MERFGYVQAASINDAVTLLNEPGLKSRALAGGTDILLQLRHEPHYCDRLVDISQLADLHLIEQRDGWVPSAQQLPLVKFWTIPLLKRPPRFWHKPAALWVLCKSGTWALSAVMWPMLRPAQIHCLRWSAWTQWQPFSPLLVSRKFPSVRLSLDPTAPPFHPADC